MLGDISPGNLEFSRPPPPPGGEVAIAGPGLGPISIRPPAGALEP